ncbi:MAG: chorismate lyase [Burkholderiales bacterium]|nr:chorismate lyase [Burkholderiales bacterium]
MPKNWIAPPPPAYDPYRPWLTYAGSLTGRIIARANEFAVERRFQGACRLAAEESQLLGLAGKRRAHVREVVLLADQVPVVFAHSVAALGDLKGAWRAVGRLGTRPLAAALFASPRVRRFPLEYRKIGPHHYLYARMAAAGIEAPATLWARRSMFCLRNRPLLVTEIFLPAILRLSK